MPLGSVNATVPTTWVATWITADSSDSGTEEEGSEGRSAVVDVIDSGSLLANPTLRIRGSIDTEIPARILFIRNALTTHDLVVNGGGVDYTIKNGAFAIVAVVPTVVSNNYPVGVHNVIKSLQLEDIILSGGGTIALDAALNSALSITDGTNEYISIDTDTQQINVHQTVSTVPTALDISIKSNDAAALTLTDGTTDFINLDSTTGAKFVEIGVPLKLENAALNSAAVDLFWSIKNNSTLSLNLLSSAGTLLNVTTAATTALTRINAIAPIATPNLGLTGNASYIEFENDGTTDFQSGGYGIRNNFGVPEVKELGGDWSQILQGIFSTAVTNSTDPGTAAEGEQKKFSFNIGPLRFCCDTVAVSNDDTAEFIVDTDSVVYTVMVCWATQPNNDGTVTAWVSNGATKEISIRNQGAQDSESITYWAVGDSGL